MFLKLKYIRLLLVGSLFFSVLISGCRQRRAIDVPSGVETRDDMSKINMRVLISEIENFEVNFDGSFQVFGSAGQVQTFVKRPVPVKVAILNNSITVNNVSFGNEVHLSRPRGEFLEFNGRRYRGNLNLYLSSDDKIMVVNELPVEYYLAGVVAAEMPASWEIEALKVQAVAARTYSLYVKFTSGDNKQWDVKSTQADQVYKGVDAEYARIWSVVDQTRGQVLTTRQSKVDYDLIPAYFSSTCGGYTVDSSLVFGNEYSPLCGVKCPYCKRTAPSKYYNWPEVRITKKELFEKLCDRYPNLRRLGSLKTIEVSESVANEDFYKFFTVDLIGTTGKKDWIKGDDLRFIVGASTMRSTACRIKDVGDSIKFYSGNGYGHNVGMCQYGAQAMAREGRGYKEILNFYYPGAEIKGLY
ncbi:MAG: SpoIID/LytB domain-containing protein [Sedimentisphaeraceae bacterium JB056]